MKRITIALCALAMVGLAVWAQARTVTVVVGQPPAAGGGGSGIDVTLDYTTLASEYRSTTTLTKPSNTADGDFLIAVIDLNVVQDTPSPPAGWTLIASRLHTDAARGSLWVYYKRASSEGASWSWTNSYTITTGIVKRFTGVVASGDPEDVGESTGETDYSTSAVSCASITTATNGAALVMVAGIRSTSVVTFSAHTLTNRVTANAGSEARVLALDADTQASAGASGAKTMTPSDWTRLLGILIALKPA